MSRGKNREGGVNDNVSLVRRHKKRVPEPQRLVNPARKYHWFRPIYPEIHHHPAGNTLSGRRLANSWQTKRGKQ
jgi:hypothetical protein